METKKIAFDEKGVHLESEEGELRILNRSIDRYLNAEHEWRSMHSFIRENSKTCDEKYRMPPKELITRYGLSYEWAPIGLAWYLLDQYFKGNITIKKDDNNQL